MVTTFGGGKASQLHIFSRLPNVLRADKEQIVNHHGSMAARSDVECENPVAMGLFVLKRVLRLEHTNASHLPRACLKADDADR
jgi:hypothetical protein